MAPLVPSETIVVAASALAASDRLNLGLALVAAAAGAVVGDNAVYGIGRRSGERLAGLAVGVVEAEGAARVGGAAA